MCRKIIITVKNKCVNPYSNNRWHPALHDEKKHIVPLRRQLYSPRVLMHTWNLTLITGALHYEHFTQREGERADAAAEGRDPFNSSHQSSGPTRPQNSYRELREPQQILVYGVDAPGLSQRQQPG